MPPSPAYAQIISLPKASQVQQKEDAACHLVCPSITIFINVPSKEMSQPTVLMMKLSLKSWVILLLMSFGLYYARFVQDLRTGNLPLHRGFRRTWKYKEGSVEGLRT